MRDKKFPILYHKGKTGALAQWEVWTEGSRICVRHGQLNGKLQISTKLAAPKNVGRSNETSEDEQAIKEAQAMWQFRIDRKHSLTIDDAQEEVFLPMLAADGKKKKFKGIVFPADAQPKLDGVRLMAYWDGDEIYLGTRSGKEWTAPVHIKKELEAVMPKQMVLDGELYIHGVDFESLSSWTKKVYPETKKLEFHVFDMPVDAGGQSESWERRKRKLYTFFELNDFKKIKWVETWAVNHVDNILEGETTYLLAGYEGLMVRNLSGKYTFGHRSNDLQKVKSSVDGEFKIVGFKDGEGREAGCVVWKCVTRAQYIFDVRPKGTLEKRAEQFKAAKKYIGKMLKVRYQNLTKEGKPRFPRGLGIRDPRDL